MWSLFLLALGRDYIFFVTVFLFFFFPLCVEWPLKVIELNFITPCQPPLGRKQLRTKIRLQKTGWEKLEEHHTCLPYTQEEHVCDCLQGKGDVTLHVVGTTYKSWAMLGITHILFLQYVHCEGYANLK